MVLVGDRREIAEPGVQMGAVVAMHPGRGFTFDIGPSGPRLVVVDQLGLVETDC